MMARRSWAYFGTPGSFGQRNRWKKLSCAISIDSPGGACRNTILLYSFSVDADSRSERRAPVQPQNLLVLMSDEHNPKMLGCYGHPLVRTPTLDRLAARGT